MTPEQRTENARRAGKAPRVQIVELVSMKVPADAATNTGRVVKAVAEGRVTERQGSLLLRLIKTWLDAYQAETIDFKAALEAHEEEMKRRYVERRRRGP